MGVLDITTKIDCDGRQEEKTLSGLESHFDDLSINESTKKDLSDLECALTKVLLRDDNEAKESQEEEEVAERENQIPAPESEEVSVCSEEKKSLKEDPVSSSSEKEDEDEASEKKEEEEDSHDEETGEVESDLKEKEESEEKEKVVCEEAEKEAESADEKEPEEDTENKKEEVSLSQKESKLDKAVPQDKEKASPQNKKRIFLSRGQGSGTHNDQQNPFMYQGYMGYGETQQGVAPMPFASHSQMLPAMSPQPGMTPNYAGHPVSPLSGYVDSSVFSPMSMSGGYYDGGMKSMDGSTGMSTNPYCIPESPCSLPDDLENYTQQSPMVPEPEDNATLSTVSTLPYSPVSGPINSPCPATTINSLLYTLDDVLVALSKVDNIPYHSIPAERLIAIKEDLEQEVYQESGVGISPGMETVHDYRQDQTFMTMPQGYMDNNYVNPPSPPFEFDLTSNSTGKELLNRLNEEKLTKSLRRLGLATNEQLTEKDEDGDNAFLVVPVQPEDSERYDENLYAIIERAKTINICCEVPVNKETKTCMKCGNADQSTFYSPISMFNKQNDTMLSSVLKARKSQWVVNYICENIHHRQVDMDRIFCIGDRLVYHCYKQLYPVIEMLLAKYD